MSVENTPNEENSPDYLNMSDEDFLNSAEPDFSQVTPSDEGEEESDETGLDEEESAEEETDASDEGTEEEEHEVSDEEEIENEEEEGVIDSEEEGEQDPENQEEVDTDDDSVDHKAELSKLLAPFKANGREVKVDSVDEAIQLMQMGANYTKKMTALKPHLRLVKTMEKYGVSEQDLSFFIDLKSKKPEAIAKFIKESGIDPMDLDLDKSSEYKPETYTATDQEVELSSILEDLRGTAGYKETIDIVGNKWDTQSKALLREHPQVLKTIHQHVADGTYAKVMNEVDKRRTLGQLSGVSDLEAYDSVGAELYSNPTGAQQEPTPREPKVVKRLEPKAKKDNPDIKSRKRAAAISTSKAGGGEQPEYNPLSLSDEEYEKMMANSRKFI